MHPHDARILAWDLMNRHGLIALGWRFRFDHARRRFGACKYGERTITLSRPLTLLNGEPEVRDTLLHEIAHALCPGDGHGLRWKARCREIGARPARCYHEQQVVSPPRSAARYVLGCGACDWWVERRRRSRLKYLCRRCRGALVYRERFVVALLLLCACVATAGAATLPSSQPAPTTAPSHRAAAPIPRQRTFRFTYAATITGLAPGQDARIWLPVPPTNADQRITCERTDLPGEPQMGVETKCGNTILYVHARANADGSIPVSVTYRVIRQEVRGDEPTLTTAQAPSADAARQVEADDAMYLRPDAKVPVNGKPMILLKDRALPADQVQLARVLYDVVDSHMQYRKDKPGWGNGDADWACDSRFGNCTDFHSLFISLARSEHIPCKFEIGFSLPAERGAGPVVGYHCWAKFRPTGHGWIPVDISEASKHPQMKEYYFGNLTPARIAFSTGRDLTLVPKQAGPPLNFFIYPYVEVDGKAWPAEKVVKKFAFEDLP